MLVPLGLLPVLTVALAAYALRPGGEAFAPVRLALVRAAVLVGAVAAVVVKALSAVRALTFPAVLTAWLVGVGIAGAAAWRRRTRLTVRVQAGVLERVLVAGLVGLMLAELVVALESPPNNWDSQTYHLPKIEHWVAQHDVAFFATRIHRQVTLAPGAEYLLVHLRLLTGGEALYNLLQWAAGPGRAVVPPPVARPPGGGRGGPVGDRVG